MNLVSQGGLRGLKAVSQGDETTVRIDRPTSFATQLEPLLNQMPESVVWDDGRVVEPLHCDRAGEVTGSEPLLYA